jgi:hypothetical protein
LGVKALAFLVQRLSLCKPFAIPTKVPIPLFFTDLDAGTLVTLPISNRRRFSKEKFFAECGNFPAPM